MQHASSYRSTLGYLAHEKQHPPGPHSRNMLRALWWSEGEGAFLWARYPCTMYSFWHVLGKGTPVLSHRICWMLLKSQFSHKIVFFSFSNSKPLVDDLVGELTLYDHWINALCGMKLTATSGLWSSNRTRSLLYQPNVFTGVYNVQYMDDVPRKGTPVGGNLPYLQSTHTPNLLHNRLIRHIQF